MSMHSLVFILFVLATLLLIINIRLWMKMREIVSKKHSIASSYGRIVEQLVPFSDSFPGDYRKFRFIGSPIDGIIFDEDEIKFVEIKSRGGKLSHEQKRIKKLVEKKKVSWHEVILK